MKKLVQICSFFCLVFAFSAISANAQYTKNVEAVIPFDFNLGGNHYNAGSYNLRISDSRSSALVCLMDNENKILDTFLVAVTRESASGVSNLVFNNYGGQRFLSRINIRESIYNVAQTRVEREIASGKKRPEKKPKTIAVATAN